MVDLNDNAAEIVVINILVCILLGISGNSAGIFFSQHRFDGWINVRGWKNSFWNNSCDFNAIDSIFWIFCKLKVIYELDWVDIIFKPNEICF